MFIKRRQYPQINTLLNNLAPGMRKHDVILTVTESVDARTYWADGSRPSYWRCDIRGHGRQLRGQNAPEPFSQFDPALHRHAVTDGSVIVQLGTFRGKTATPRIYGTPAMFKQLGVEVQS